MTLNIETAHPILQVAVGICVITFLLTFILALYSTLLVITKSRALIDVGDNRQVGLCDRWGSRNSRFGSFLVDRKFRFLRILHYAAWGTAIVSFLTLFVLILVFGEAARR